jgi:hypothetical protein
VWSCVRCTGVCIDQGQWLWHACGCLCCVCCASAVDLAQRCWADHSGYWAWEVCFLMQQSHTAFCCCSESMHVWRAPKIDCACILTYKQCVWGCSQRQIGMVARQQLRKYSCIGVRKVWGACGGCVRCSLSGSCKIACDCLQETWHGAAGSRSVWSVMCAGSWYCFRVGCQGLAAAGTVHSCLPFA